MAAVDSGPVQPSAPEPAGSGNVVLMRANGQQDAFDKDDFDAVAYINEVFPTGARRSRPETAFCCITPLGASAKCH